MSLTREEQDRLKRYARLDREARSASCAHCGKAVSALDRCTDNTYLHTACAHATQTKRTP